MMHKTPTSKFSPADVMRVPAGKYGLSDHMYESQIHAAFKARSHSSATAESLALFRNAQPFPNCSGLLGQSHRSVTCDT